MERYFVYEVKFSTSTNKIQKDALDALNDCLPDQIIVNTSMPMSRRFAKGEEIGTQIEVESETSFDPDMLAMAMTIANGTMGSNIIESVQATGENIVDEEGHGVLTDLVDLAE